MKRKNQSLLRSVIGVLLPLCEPGKTPTDADTDTYPHPPVPSYPHALLTFILWVMENHLSPFNCHSLRVLWERTGVPMSGSSGILQSGSFQSHVILQLEGAREPRCVCWLVSILIHTHNLA